MECVNYTLLGAAIEGDVQKVQELLNQGADPICLVKYSASLLYSSTKRNNEKMVALILKHVFLPENNNRFKEVVADITECNKNSKLLQEIFKELVHREPSQIDLLELLLKRGLPIDDSINEHGYTLLLSSIFNKRNDFVSLLVKNGADVNKKTKAGVTPLHLAISFGDASTIEELLQNGAKVNETDNKGRTALHLAYGYDLKKVSVLLDNGADINMYDKRRKTPLMCAVDYKNNINIFIKYLALLKFQHQPVCFENSECLRLRKNLQKMFDDCLKELQRMKNEELYNGFTLYDILKMRKQKKKLIFLTKHKDFIEAFKLNWNRESYENYGPDLGSVFEDALKSTDLLSIKKENC